MTCALFSVDDIVIVPLCMGDLVMVMVSPIPGFCSASVEAVDDGTLSSEIITKNL